MGSLDDAWTIWGHCLVGTLGAKNHGVVCFCTRSGGGNWGYSKGLVVAGIARKSPGRRLRGAEEARAPPDLKKQRLNNNIGFD